MLPSFPSIVAKRDRLNSDTIRRLVRKKAPMLADLPGHIVHEGRVTAILRVDGETEPTKVEQHSALLEIPRMNVVEFMERHEEYLNTIAEQFAESQSKQIISVLSDVTDKTGNVVDGKGQPFSDDLLYEMLEKMAHSFSPSGEWQPPSLVVSPELHQKIVEYDKARTPEQRSESHERLQKLIQLKKAEYDSEQAGRVLAG